MALFMPAENNKGNNGVQQDTTAKVYNNPSSQPGAGQQKVETNLDNTVSGVKLDNKNIGTNAAQNTVNNWINDGQGNYPTLQDAIKTYTPNEKYVDFQNQVTEAQQRAEALPASNPNYAQNLTDYMAQNRIGSADNRTFVGNLNNQRTDKINSSPDYAQYANDDISKRAAFYAQYGVDPTIDIEAEIDKFRNAHPVLTAEDAAILQQLLTARDAKITLHPELEQYRNSYGTDMANIALRGYEQENRINDAYNDKINAYNGLNDLTDEYVALMKEEAARHRDNSIRKAETEALEQRRNLIASAPITDLALQEQLSQMGLTRGTNNSSGYGENARLMAQLNISNQVADVKKQLNQNVLEYENAYLDAIMEADRTGLSQKIDVQKLIADVGPEAALAIINVENTKYDRENATRDFYEKQRQFDLGYGLDTRRTDAEITHMDRTDDREDERLAHEIAYDAKNFGLKTVELYGEVTTPELSELLGVPVGTKTLEAINSAKELVIAEKNAETNRMNARTNESEAMLNKMVNTWEATGAANPEVAAYFDVPEGTTFYQYVHDLNKINAQNSGKKSSGSGTVGGLELPDPYGNNERLFGDEDGAEVKTSGATPVSPPYIQDNKFVKTAMSMAGLNLYK